MNNKLKPPPVPGPRFGTLFGGMAVVATGMAAWWYGLLRHQSRKEERGEYNTWEYRILQAQAPTENAERPATLRTSMSTPGNSSSAPGPPTPGMLGTHADVGGANSSQARADRAVPDAPQSKAGRSDSNAGPSAGPEPTPQRTRDDDDRIYTKAPRYVDDYDEHKKH